MAYTLIEFAYSIAVALAGLAAARAALWALDHSLGFNFKAWYQNASSTDKAMYYSARFIGVCLLLGLALS